MSLCLFNCVADSGKLICENWTVRDCSRVVASPVTRLQSNCTKTTNCSYMNSRTALVSLYLLIFQHLVPDSPPRLPVPRDTREALVLVLATSLYSRAAYTVVSINIRISSFGHAFKFWRDLGTSWCHSDTGTDFTALILLRCYVVIRRSVFNLKSALVIRRVYSVPGVYKTETDAGANCGATTKPSL
jgi:hypothetical protein